MTSTKDSGKCKVATALKGTSIMSVLQLKILGLSSIKSLLSRPFKSISPCLVSKPVADEISITSIDQDWDFLKDTWDQSVERLHPVTLEEEVSVDIKVTAIITAHFNTEFLLNIGLVQEFTNPTKSRVAQVAAIFTLATDIINILYSISMLISD